MHEEVESKRLVAIEGDSGVGKTYQCGTLIKGLPELGLPGWNVAYASTERKANTIKHLKSQYTSKPIMNLDFPSTVDEKALMLATGGSDFIKLFDELRRPDHEYDVLFVDSVSRYAEKFLGYLMATVATKGGDADTRKAYGIFGKKMRAFLDVLATLADGTVNPKPVHVVAVWGVETGTDWRGQRKTMPMVDGNMVHQRVNYYFDDVLFLDMEEDLEKREKKYVLHTTGNGQFTAKISSNVELPATIANPNLFQIINILDGKLVKQGGEWKRAA